MSALRDIAHQLANLERVRVRAVIGEVIDTAPLTVSVAGGTPVPAARLLGDPFSAGNLVLCLSWPGQLIVIGVIE